MTAATVQRMGGMSRRVEETADSLSSFDTGRLREMLIEAVSATVEQVIRVAAIVRLLEERGESVADMMRGYFPYIRRVAYGQMVPEAVVMFQGQLNVMRRVSLLPLPDQSRIASNEPMSIANIDGDVRLLRPSQMTPREVRQVFADDHTRDPDEQVAWLRSQAASPSTATKLPIQVARGKKGIVVTGSNLFISKSDLKMWLERIGA